MKKILILITFIVVSQSYCQNNINKIKFSTIGYASEPDFEMYFFEDRTVVFNAIKDNYKEKVKGEIVAFGTDENGLNIRKSEKVGIYKAKLKRKDYKHLTDLVLKLNNEFKIGTFSSNQIHYSEVKLQVIMKNGKILLIHDMGMKGSKKLIELYDFIKELRFNQHWD